MHHCHSLMFGTFTPNIVNLWQNPLVGLNTTANTLIGAACCLILLLIIYLVRLNQSLSYQSILILFSALIDLNKQLNREIFSKENAKNSCNLLYKELEQRVEEKTAALVRANQDLQASTVFREKITDLTPNILYIFDLKTSRNIYCNPFISELLGYTPIEIQKFKAGLLEELIHPEDIELVKQHFANYLSLKQDNYLKIEYRIKNVKGEWHWLHDKNAIFSYDNNGEPAQILGIAQDVTQTKKNQLETIQLNQKLEEKILVLEARNQDRIKLAQLNEFIQACVSLDEAQEVIADLLWPLFPNTAGTLYLISNSKNILSAIAIWGDSHSRHNFEPKNCWAIRRGDIHISYPHATKLYCSHVDKSTPQPSLCLPMIARGETIGLLHLDFKHQDTIDRSIQNLAKTVAQNLAMSFANLQLQQKLRYQSFRDPLTGMYNRRYLQEALKKEIDRAQRKGQFVSIMMLDIDHFKRFNDVYGHSAGDLVLNQVGSYLLSEIRQYDIACRFGGEELIIVMPDINLENTVLGAERIREGIKSLHLEHEGKILQAVTVSIGVSCFPDDGTKAEDLIKAADRALYRAKEDGRDCVKRC